MSTRRRFLGGLLTIPAAGLAQSIALPGAPAVASAADELSFSDRARTSFGDWSAEATLSSRTWTPGNRMGLDVVFHLAPDFIQALSATGVTPDTLLMLVTCERTFDADGWMRFASDERMSTLLTPTGLAIEGGNSGAVSRYTGARHRTPFDVLVRLPLWQMETTPDARTARLHADLPLPTELPPGLYRVRLDFGFAAGRRNLSLNNEGFAARPTDLAFRSLMYSPLVPSSGADVSGRVVDATRIAPRVAWVLLGQYNSNGYQGVVADEDRGRFALSDRNIIPDEVILPLYNAQDRVIGYSLEPEVRADLVDEQRSIPWNYSSGELSARVTDPSGTVTDLGTLPFTGRKGRGPTTGSAKLTQWKPSGYGRYTVVVQGWMADRWGNRYDGGGTYHFWIAKRMTMATATFQGMAYPVGSRYGRDIGFAPAVPADVTIQVDMYPNSDPSAVRSLTYGGKASPGGIFGAAHGMKSFALDVPGEYHARILATHADPEGHLWVCAMRHAGVVYPPDSPLVAHGKKLAVDKQLVDRGETHYEGYIEPGEKTTFKHLDHINFPYQAGDALLIASEGQGANKIEPVLTYEIKDSGPAYDPKWQPIGLTNVRIATSNGYSPHLYPEYITDLAYFYAAGPRPGFSSRFLVGEDGTRAPYWPTSASNFGGQIGTSNNGDEPGTIYRLIGGVVLRRKNQLPLYAGYLSSGFIVPGGSNNNRVVAAGSEEIQASDGVRARFMVVPLRPGMVYELGTAYRPAFQIDPVLPVHVRVGLRFPDGSERVAEGTGDAFGAFVGPAAWTLDQPGIYTFTIDADWNGFQGHVPGLPPEGGQFYVLDSSLPPGRLGLNLKNQQTFTVDDGLAIEGTTTAGSVFFAAVTPGLVLEQGVLAVQDGVFRYHFDPVSLNERLPFYDIANRRTGRKELGRVIHLTFFAREQPPDGDPFHSFARIILRGNTAIYTS